MTEWTEVTSELINNAQRIINESYPYLLDARIAFVFRDEAQKTAGRKSLGGVQKVPAKLQTFLEYDFIIWISEDDYSKWDYETRLAMLDHYLAFCIMGEGGWKIRKPDIEAFSFVIARHGLYTADIARAAEAIEIFKQNPLFEESTHVTISGLGKVVTMTGEQLHKAAEMIGSD